MLRAIGKPELASDERFATVREQRRNRVELIALLDETFARRPLEEWAERFDAEGVWWAPVQSPAEALADQQALAAGAVVEVAGMEGGVTRQVAAPIALADSGPRGPAPRLGAHTDDVLREAGLGNGEIENLRRLGALGDEKDT